MNQSSPAPSPEGARKTAWQEAESIFSNSDQFLPHSTDILIVGAGITGLTAALHLQRAGRSVTVIDKGTAGNGTTGRSSAHLTTLLDSGLAETEKTFSAEANRQIVNAMRRAIDHIEEQTRLHNITCHFKKVCGYYFTEDAKETDAVAAESEAARRAGLEPQAVLDIRLPFPIAAAFRIPEQAIFDPAAYIRGLALAFRDNGGLLLEHTRLLDFHDGHPCTAETSRGRIESHSVILATHTPLGRSLLHAELEPSRSYLIAAEMKDGIPSALFWDTASPYHYMRRIERAEQTPLLLVGGADHKTGKEPLRDPYQELEEWLRERVETGPIAYRWSAQYYKPIDGLPYVGRPVTESNIFVATGFNGDGLTLGTAAGELLADLVQGRNNDLGRLLSPARLRVKAAAKAVSLNVDAARHLFSGKGDGPDPEPGRGIVRGSDDGTVAEYRDPAGTVIRLSARCPHLGCIVRWNPLENSWDCPCHGSRFSPEGECLEGPSHDDLQKMP